MSESRPRYAQGRITFGGRQLGENKNATLQITVNGVVKDVTDVNQFEGIFASLETGVIPEVRATFYDVIPYNVYTNLFPGRFKTLRDGSRSVMFFGNRRNDLKELAEELVIHDEGVSNVTRTYDFKAWKAAAVFDGTVLTYDRDTPQDITITWKIFPDSTKPYGKEYGAWGDWALSASSALFVYIADSARALDYDEGKHMRQLLLKEEERRQTVAIAGFYGEGSSASGDLKADGVTPITFTIDEGSNLLPGDDEVTFDGLNEASYITAGMWVKLSSAGTYEWAKIDSVSYSSSTAGTIQFAGQRALFDTPVKLQHANNAVCTIYSDIGFADVSADATWAETGAAVTVGATDGGTGDDKPGVVAYAAQGAGQVTATYGGKTSPTLACLAVKNGTVVAASYPKTTSGAQTLLAAATYARSVCGFALVTETFADGDTSQTEFDIGETGTADKFMADTVLASQSAGEMFGFGGTLDANDALLVTATAAAGTGTGAIDVFAFVMTQ